MHPPICQFFISRKSVDKSGFVDKLGESWQIGSVGDFIRSKSSGDRPIIAHDFNAKKHQIPRFFQKIKKLFDLFIKLNKLIGNSALYK